jgi:hypothetical protein
VEATDDVDGGLVVVGLLVAVVVGIGICIYVRARRRRKVAEAVNVNDSQDVQHFSGSSLPPDLEL